MAIDKIQSESINLADTFAFTGTVSGTPNDYVKITETVLSSNATYFSFTSSGSPNIFSSEYRKLHFYLTNCRGIGSATNSHNIKFNTSIDAGSNYNVAKTSCVTLANHNASGAGGAIGYEQSYDSAGSTGDINLMVVAGANTDKSNGLMMTLEQPYSSNSWKNYSCYGSTLVGGATNVTYNYTLMTSGNIQTTTALSGIRFSLHENGGGGNIGVASGAICSVYGVK